MDANSVRKDCQSGATLKRHTPAIQQALHKVGYRFSTQPLDPDADN